VISPKKVIFFTLFFLLGLTSLANFHPLRLSLCEIEYDEMEKELVIHLKLFLMDVNEALLFDPDNNELAFCQPNESPNADRMLLSYLNDFFYVKANGELVDLEVSKKELSGEGDNVALGVLFKYDQENPLEFLEIKNAVFTDLFFDQSNIVYVHVNGQSKSLMLNKKTSTHQLNF